MTHVSPKKNRILVVAPTPFFSDRGTPIRILEEVKQLVAAGFAVDILTYPIGERPLDLPDSVRIFRCLNVTPWYNKRDAGPSIEKIALDAMMQLSLTRLRITQRYDAIHAHLHEGIQITHKSQIVSWLLRKPTLFVGDLHGSLTEEVAESGFIRSKLLLKLVMFYEHFLEKRPHILVTSSEKNTERVAAYRTKHTFTIADGVPVISGTTSKSDARTALGIQDRGQFIAAYTGGFGSEKGITLLLDTVRARLRDTPNLDWILAGNMSAQQHTAFSAEFSETQRVTLITPLSYHALPHVLAAADFGVDPKPLTSTQASGKWMNYAGAGSIPVHLAAEPALLTELVRDPELRHRKQAETKAYAAAHSWETTMHPLIDIYARL